MTLGSAKLVAFITVGSAAHARAFYGNVLGLRLISEDNFALVFDANGTMLRVAIAERVAAAPYTVLGWEVGDIQTTVRDLARAGVRFERYPGMPQDEIGIWTSPSGARVAWFKDLDGNTLSVSQA
jgi:catechol 2,3-dioxygenase-like lactoylglutathione lyase family enzyme